MDKSQVKVYLGFEDEPFLDENGHESNFMTNKIGGKPKWPTQNGIYPSQCNVCGLQRPLLLQCYAPLPLSEYHRTLYIFACINPTCWNNTNSWSCFRFQYLDEEYAKMLKETMKSNIVKDSPTPSVAVASDSWCCGAEEWGDDDQGDINAFTETTTLQNHATDTNDRMSDSEEDDNFIDGDDIDLNIEKMSLDDTKNQSATAEIEKDMTEDVIVDEVNIPDNNLIKLLCQVPDLPEELKAGGTVQFESKYIAVEQELLYDDGKSDHVQKLLQQYQAENSEDLQTVKSKHKSKGKKCEEVEEYERVVPRHGNEIFHNFLTRLQMNPTQILRYSHNGQPLPMSPLPSSLKSMRCPHCKGKTNFELQILPTIIPSLKIRNSTSSHLEFGTAYIFTCSASCWEPNGVVKNEIVFVQREPA